MADNPPPISPGLITPIPRAPGGLVGHLPPRPLVALGESELVVFGGCNGAEIFNGVCAGTARRRWTTCPADSDLHLRSFSELKSGIFTLIADTQLYNVTAFTIASTM